MPFHDGTRRENARTLSHARGNVITVGNTSGDDGLKALAALAPFVRAEPESGFLRLLKRRTENGSIYYITNEDVRPWSGTLSFSETLPGRRLCADDGTWFSLSENCRYGLTLQSGEGALLFFTDEVLPCRTGLPVPGKELQRLTDFTLVPLRQLRIKHDGIVTEVSDSAPVPAHPGDWSAYLGADFSGETVYRAVFDCPSYGSAACLDLGGVGAVCSVFLNGTALGDAVYRPYCFRIRGLLKEKDNLLEIRVANTPANEVCHTGVFADRKPEEIGGYHQRCLAFERSAAESGLFGPVILCTEAVSAAFSDPCMSRRS